MSDTAELIGVILGLIFAGFLLGYTVGIGIAERTRCEYCGHVIATMMHKDDRVIVDGVMYHRECYDKMLKERGQDGE